MDCPKDRHTLQAFAFGDIRIDRCPACGGAWYDRDELRLLKDHEARGDYRWIDVDLWRDREKFGARGARYACPRDGTMLTSLHYGESAILVDICGRCGGLWLDKGEYARIIELLEDLVDSSTVDDYLEDMRDEFRELVAPPEGLGSELSDLGKVLYLLELRFTIEHPAVQSFLDALPKA